MVDKRANDPFAKDDTSGSDLLQGDVPYHINGPPILKPYFSIGPGC
jgi:hypothetical protein